MTPMRPRNALIALDLLRFAAAAMVMAFHFTSVWVHDKQAAAFGIDVAAALRVHAGDLAMTGWVGVEIFFVLSGYVIAASARGASAQDFAWRRLMRLWPGALVCASLTALVLLANGADTDHLGTRWLASAMLFPLTRQIDPSYWTLGVECAFYSLVALLLALGQWRPLPLAKALVWSGCAFWVWQALHGFRGMPLQDLAQQLTLTRFGCLFGAGILLEERHRDPETVSLLAFVPALTAGLIYVFYHNWVIYLGEGGTARLLTGMAAFLAGFAVIASAPKVQPLLARLGLARVAVALGLATYPLYLLHQRVGMAAAGALARHGLSLDVARPLVAVAMIVLALIVALVLEPAIRDPLNAWRRSLQSRPARDLRPDSPRSAFLRAG